MITEEAVVTSAPIFTENEVPVQKTTVAKENTRQKTSLNLGNILKPQFKTEEVKEEQKGPSPKQDDPIIESKLRHVWNEYAEQRKNQVAEYHILSQTFTLKNNLITLLLNNPIEEPILQGMKADLVGYLRERLNNSTLQIEGELQQNNTKRKAYTNKEKFDYLVEKNPYIKELQEKLGLDPDY